MRVAGSAAPDFAARCRGAFLGLALGDSYGRTLEFVRQGVREQPVAIDASFRWTDDTHMALYLADAVLRQPAGPLDEDRFGEAVGERFVAWRADPLTPSTAPGGTCLRGAGQWERLRDWRRSGDPTSDGCGAVMRIAPLPMAWSGDELVNAALVSAAITHAHPNALEGAVAACWMLRRVLEDGAFGAAGVREAIDALQGEWSRGGAVASALEAALAFADSADEWLPEEEIPTHDGGWRSASALGLAVAAALRWGPDFELTVEKAARIQGDSDSVACLAGMFLGAAGAELPAAWLAHLPERERIEELAARLAARA